MKYFLTFSFLCSYLTLFFRYNSVDVNRSNNIILAHECSHFYVYKKICQIYKIKYEPVKLTVVFNPEDSTLGKFEYRDLENDTLNVCVALAGDIGECILLKKDIYSLPTPNTMTDSISTDFDYAIKTLNYDNVTFLKCLSYTKFLINFDSVKVMMKRLNKEKTIIF